MYRQNLGRVYDTVHGFGSAFVRQVWEGYRDGLEILRDRYGVWVLVGYWILFLVHWKLKADRPHPRNYPHMQTNYRHTDKHPRLVMTLNALCCTRQTEPLISTVACQKFELDLWPWPLISTLTLKQGKSDVKTRFLEFDLELWPTIPGRPLAKYKGQKVKGQNCSAVRALTNGLTDGRTLPSTLSPSFVVDKKWSQNGSTLGSVLWYGTQPHLWYYFGTTFMFT